MDQLRVTCGPTMAALWPLTDKSYLRSLGPAQQRRNISALGAAFTAELSASCGLQVSRRKPRSDGAAQVFLAGSDIPACGSCSCIRPVVDSCKEASWFLDRGLKVPTFCSGCRDRRRETAARLVHWYRELRSATAASPGTSPASPPASPPIHGGGGAGEPPPASVESTGAPAPKSQAGKRALARKDAAEASRVRARQAAEKAALREKQSRKDKAAAKAKQELARAAQTQKAADEKARQASQAAKDAQQAQAAKDAEAKAQLERDEAARAEADAVAKAQAEARFESEIQSQAWSYDAAAEQPRAAPEDDLGRALLELADRARTVPPSVGPLIGRERLDLSDQQVAQALRDAGLIQTDLDMLEECERDELYPTDESWWDHMVLAGDYVADLANGFRVPFADYSAYRKLLRAHDDHLAAVEAELVAGKKESCWLWYVLPTGRKGTNDLLQTYLTRATARELVMRFPDDLREPHPLSPSWRGVLQRLGILFAGRIGPETRRRLGLTDADILRVRDFVKFWGLVDSKPVWLVRVLEDLADGLDEHDGQD